MRAAYIALAGEKAHTPGSLSQKLCLNSLATHVQIPVEKDSHTTEINQRLKRMYRQRKSLTGDLWKPQTG